MIKIQTTDETEAGFKMSEIAEEYRMWSWRRNQIVKVN